MVAKQKNIPTKIYIYKEKNIMKFNLIRLFFVAVISLCIVGLYTISRTALAGENNTNSGSGHDYWKDHDGNSDDKTSVHGKKKRNPKKEWQTRGNKNIDAKKHFLGTTNAADLVIKTDNNEKMRVTTDGDVGIGVTNPQGKLDVGERTDPVGGTCPIGYNHVDYNEDGFIDEGECWRGMIVKNGTVGIGTVSPTLTLDVNGQIRIRGGSPFAGAVLTSDSFGNASWMSVIIDDDDSDPTNELQTMSLEGTNLTIENGNTVDLSPLQNGSTTDNQTLALTGTNLSIEDGNTVDLAALSGTDTDNQALTFSGTSLSIEDGNSVDLASLSGTDTDDQTLTFTGTSLSIADGNTVDLAALSGTNTDNQDLTSATLSGTLLSINIEGGSGTAVDLSSLQDGSGTDDQTLTFSGTNLSIADGNTVDLAALSGTNTDNQDLTSATLSGTLLSINIEGGSGTAVDLSSLQDGSGTDDQSLTFDGTSLTIESGNTVDLAALSGTDTDDQTLEFSGTSLTIVDGNTVDLAALSGTNTDNQDLTSATLSGTLLSINIEGGSGTAVDLSSLQDGSGTDDQDLTGSSLVGTLLNIDIEDGTGTSVDLEPLRLWSSGTSTDIHYDPGNVGIGTTGPPTHKLTLEGANGFGLINSLSTLRVEIAYDSDGSWIDVNNAAGTPVAFLGADNEDGTGYLGVGQGTISTVAPYEELDRVSIWGGGGIFVKNNSDVSLVNILSSAGYGWVDLFDATGSSRVTLNGDQGAIKLHKNGKDGVFLHSNGFARIRNDAYATLELIGDDDNTGTEAANITMSLDGGNESWTMGTTNPETNFEQAGFFLSHYDAFGTGTAYAAMSIQGGTSTTSPTMAKGIWFNAESIGGNTGWNAASDARLKKNVSTIENALDIVDNLRGVWFDWKDTEREGREIGFIAQEVQEILPEVVNANGKFLGMQYSKITALLVEAIKELKAENEDLKATLGKSKAGNENANSMKENNELKEKLATMEKRLDKYESMMLAILNDLPRNKMVNIEQLMSDDAQKSVH